MRLTITIDVSTSLSDVEYAERAVRAILCMDEGEGVIAAKAEIGVAVPWRYAIECNEYFTKANTN